MAGQIDVAALLGAVMEENTAQIEALLTPLNIPKGDPLAGVAMIEGRTDIESRFLGIQCLAGFVRARGDIRFAAELALHLVKALKSHNFFEPEQPVHSQFMAANVLDLCASCLPDAGRGAELLAQAPEWVAWLDQAHFNAQWRSVQCAHAEAAMHAGAYELAARLLGLLRQRSGESQTSPIERRLNDKLEDLLRAVDQPDTPSASLATIIEQSLKQLGWDGLAGNSAFQELPPSELVTKAEQFGALIGLGPAPQGLEQITEAIGLLPNAAHPFHEVSNVLTSLANVLASVKPGNVSQYVYVANLAEQACKCARAYGFWEQDISLGWLQGVALRRAGRQRSAAAVLAQLRQSIRERQRGIREVKLRAALAVHLPHLSAVSAEVLFQLGAGSEEELFQVIENSKARILGDLITERFRDSEAPESLKPLRQLLGQSRQRVSYISLLLDEEVTYAILLSPEGVLHPAQLKFGRTAVAAAAQELGFLNDGEPGSLVREAGIDPDRPWDTDYGPVFVAIRGLGAWLASLFDRGILRDGDVVCFAPDGPLYNLPLAAIPVGDKPLIERVALTFVPSAEMLLHCARFRSAQPLQRGFSMVVPRSTEFDSRLYDLEFYNKDADELRKHWQTMAVAPEKSDRERLLQSNLDGTVVHLAGHGHFDAQAPLKQSGLMLAAEGKLPPGRGPGISRGLFSPEDTGRLQARGSHITIRACVSGRTTEVTSREALGMIWALFQSGASSLMAASWHADARSLIEFLVHFYGELPRVGAAQAHRTAGQRIRAMNHNWTHPYHYAALNLFGYWD